MFVHFVCLYSFTRVYLMVSAGSTFDYKNWVVVDLNVPIQCKDTVVVGFDTKRVSRNCLKFMNTVGFTNTD